MTNFQLRVSVINTPDDLSPLKLRGFLLQQAREIQTISTEHAHTRIKLFLSKRQRYAFTQKKLDTLLQGIVDKFPAIYSIELIDTEKSLTNSEMAIAIREANEELDALDTGLKERFGTNSDSNTH